MPKMKLSVPHTLDKTQAAARLKGYFEKLREYGGDRVSDLKEEWADDHTLNFGFTTYGIRIEGQMAVQEKQVAIDATIPIAAMMFKGKIEQQTREQLEKALA